MSALLHIDYQFDVMSPPWIKILKPLWKLMFNFK